MSGMVERVARDNMLVIKWLSRQSRLVWGGIYSETPTEISQLENLGIIERKRIPYSVGELRFPGGFRITPYGRRLISLALAKQ